jgi:pterin-4a-carbinolamine dehydratase
VHDATISRDLEPVYQEIRRHLSSAAPAPAQPTAERRLPYPNPPMKFKPAPIAGDELALVVAEELTEWSIQTGPVPGKPGVTGVELHRDLQFPRFRDVLPYMAIVADFAQKANHHPRWENIFRTLSINLTTWDIGHQVSILDVVLAAYCDRAYLQYIDSLGSPSDAAHTRSSQ